MGFKNETPLRGWKEILPAINAPNKDSGRSILKTKGLLHYENNAPVLLLSEYLSTLPRAKPSK